MADKDLVQRFLYGAQAGSGTINVNAPPVMQPQVPRGVERYARPNVPLDVTTGVDWKKRIGLSFIDNPENRQAFLRNAFNGSQVDRTDDGQLIIRNVLDTNTGQAKDLLLDEEEISGRDLADMVGAGVKTGAELLAMWGLGGVAGVQRLGNVGRLIADSAAGAAASEGVGLTAEALQLSDVEYGDLLKQHASGALKGTGMGIVMGGAVQSAIGAKNMIQGRLSGDLAPKEAERVGIRALNEVNRETGLDIRPSIGQLSGDPDILRLESFLERLPFFGSAFRKQRELREASIADLQEKIIGDAPLQPMSEAGARLADVVRTAVREPRQMAALAESNIELRAAKEIENLITSIQPSARSFTTEGTSALTKFAAQSRMENFRTMADRLFSEAGNPEIPTAPLKPFLEKIHAELPKRTVINESDLVDVAGRPLATIEGEEIVRELVPSELQRFMSGLESLDETMPLDQLRRIRNTVDSAINSVAGGRGLESVNAYELKQLQHAITETINQGAAQLGKEGEALLRANAFYRENIERFEVPMIARLLKTEPNAPGFIGNNELIETIRNNPDRFNDVKNFLQSSLTEGGKSIGKTGETAFNVLRRSILEDIYSRARVNPGTTSAINADAFLSDLKRFTPEVRSELLGITQETLEKNLDLLRQLKSGFKEVPLDSLESFLRFPANEIDDLSRLATARKKEAKLFENEVISKILKGGDEAEELASDRGVEWLLNSKSRSDVSEVMRIASDDPNLVESIRRNAAARLFQEIAQKTKPSDAARIGETSVLVNPSKLIEAFRDRDRAERLRIILGNSTFNIMENFAKSQAILGKEGSNTLLGTTTATSMLTHMLRFFRDVPHAAKLTIYSTILTNPTLQKALAEGSLEAATDPRAFAQAAIASVPVLEALSEQYGKTGAEMILQSFKDGLTFFRNEDKLGMSRTESGQQQPAAGSGSTNVVDQFLKGR